MYQHLQSNGNRLDCVNAPSPLGGEEIVLMQPHASWLTDSTRVSGSLVITTYRTLFNCFGRRRQWWEVTHGHAMRIVLKSVVSRFARPLTHRIFLSHRDQQFTFHTKDHRTLIVQCRSTAQWCAAAEKTLQQLCFSGEVKTFAFRHVLPHAHDDGWSIFALSRWLESCVLSRQPLTPDYNGYFRVSLGNTEAKLSPTYPSLLCVPSAISEEVLAEAVKFRSRHRFPAVVWRHPVNGASLARCSQPVAGLRNKRSGADEQLIDAIRLSPFLCRSSNRSAAESASKSKKIYFLDARPLKAALGNQLMGKGMEDMSNYEQSELHFLNIDNIHAIRSSLGKLFEYLTAESTQTASDLRRLVPTTGPHTLSTSSSASSSSAVTSATELRSADDGVQKDALSNDSLNRLADTQWLHYTSLILKSSAKVAALLHRGNSVLIHCSDGWDRTAQLSSLAQLMLDPSMRTMRGFCSLIESDWVSFGHQFSRRFGHGSDKWDDDQRSPIFLQWLDCVHQLVHQFPLAFEFTDEFLLELHYHLESCRFGTFLCNTDADREAMQLHQRTVSIWTHLLHPKHAYRFKNAMYESSSVHANCSLLLPNTALSMMHLWTRCYSRHVPSPHRSPNVDLSTAQNTVLTQLLEVLQIQGHCEMSDVLTIINRVANSCSIANDTPNFGKRGSQHRSEPSVSMFEMSRINFAAEPDVDDQMFTTRSANSSLSMFPSMTDPDDLPPPPLPPSGPLPTTSAPTPRVTRSSLPPPPAPAPPPRASTSFSKHSPLPPSPQSSASSNSSDDPFAQFNTRKAQTSIAAPNLHHTLRPPPLPSSQNPMSNTKLFKTMPPPLSAALTAAAQQQQQQQFAPSIDSPYSSFDGSLPSIHPEEADVSSESEHQSPIFTSSPVRPKFVAPTASRASSTSPPPLPCSPSASSSSSPQQPSISQQSDGSVRALKSRFER